MSGITRSTQGSVAQERQTQAVTLNTKLLQQNPGLPAPIIPPASDTVSIANVEETIGILSAQALCPLDNSNIEGATPSESNIPAIKLTLIPTFPNDLRTYFAILRGRVEYKRRLNDTPLKIIYEQTTTLTNNDPIEIIDEDIEVGVHYYYSVVALIGSGTEQDHLEYNPNTGFASAYGYSRYGHGEIMFNLLPEEWTTKQKGRKEDFTHRFIEIFGKLFDTIKSDVDTYMLTSQNLWSVQEQQLQALASIIGWEVNRELRESVQRQEVDSGSDFYNVKGRDQGIRFLIQLVTGWLVEFEQGWRRVCRTDGLCRTPSHSDIYAISHKGLPWVEQTDLFSSSGTASQIFILSQTFTERVIVEIDEGSGFVEWLEIPLAELNTGGDISSETYSVSEDPVTGIATITLPDILNGSIPSSGVDNVRISYHYGGDRLHYTVEYPPDMGWRNPNGVRIILRNIIGSQPIDDVIINKIRRILNLKSSYVIYSTLIIPEAETALEVVPPAVDEFDDTTITTATVIVSNTAGHQSNVQTYISAGAP